jgi:hypothetical protein
MSHPLITAFNGIEPAERRIERVARRSGPGRDSERAISGAHGTPGGWQAGSLVSDRI